MRLRDRFSPTEQRSLADHQPAHSGLWINGNRGLFSSKKLAPREALSIPAFFSASQLLANSVSQLDRRIVTGFRPTDSVPAAFQPAWLDSPGSNSEPWVDLCSSIVLSLILHGEAVLAITRDGAGEIIDLDVVPPDSITRTKTGWVTSATTARPGVRLEQHLDIAVIPWLLIPGEGCRGVGPVEAASKALRHSLSIADASTNAVTNGALPSGLLTIDDHLSPEELQETREGWIALHGGTGNVSKTAILSGGWKFNPISHDVDALAFPELRKLSISEAARILGVPPHLIGDASGSTSWGSGLAEQDSAFAKYTLTGYVARIEQHISLAIQASPAPQTSTKWLDIDLGSIQRGTPSQEAERWNGMVAAGVATPNEARRAMRMRPIDDPAADRLVVKSAGDSQLAAGVRALQQVYLAVGKVITSAEARQIIRQYGIDLGSGDLPPAPATEVRP